MIVHDIVSTIGDKIVDALTFLPPYFVTVVRFCPASLSFQPPSPPNNVARQFM